MWRRRRIRKQDEREARSQPRQAGGAGRAERRPSANTSGLMDWRRRALQVRRKRRWYRGTTPGFLPKHRRSNVR
jgi:hypothetical protein